MEELIGFALQVIIFVFFVGTAYFIGKYIETSHYEKIQKSEKQYLDLPVVTSKKIVDPAMVEESWLVFGSVVISSDYFKLILASLHNFFGGRITCYESLLDRARREAIIRMKRKAKEHNADIILNMRFETSKLDSFTGKNQGTGMFELLAYGTAVKYLKPCS